MKKVSQAEYNKRYQEEYAKLEKETKGMNFTGKPMQDYIDSNLGKGFYANITRGCENWREKAENVTIAFQRIIEKRIYGE